MAIRDGAPSEAVEQEALVRWAAWEAKRTPELRLLFHVPNGGRRDKREAARLKAQGVKPGVPDLFLPVPRGGYHGLWIELKAAGGRPSANQCEWIGDLNEQGYRAVICYGWDAAREEIGGYLKSGE